MRHPRVFPPAPLLAGLLLSLLTCTEPTGVRAPEVRELSAPELAAVSAAPVLLAAGDIASCDSDQGDAMTAAVINSTPGATVVTLGDNAYPDGAASDYANCYDPTWGEFKDRTRPSLGNHEYYTGNATASFDYFGDAAWGGSRPNGYYSFDLGDWHLIVLNDNNKYVSIGASSAQVKWLKADLAANTRPCTMAIWHQPLFSSSYSGSPGYLTSRKNLWEPLYAARADVVLNAHKHVYERFGLQDPLGNPTPDGLRQFIVGTGGDNTGGKPTVLSPNSEVQHGGRNQFGVLKLTLESGSYDWEYLPVGNNAFTDQGSTVCHRAGLAVGATMAKSDGDGQTAAAGTAVAVPPSVRITDASGAPVEGTSVTFSVTLGGGSVTGAVQVTDADGIAAVGSWTLGQVTGSNALSAGANGVGGSPVSFSATGAPGPASPGATTATVPSGVAGKVTTITVRTRDQFGNPLRTGGAAVAVAVSGANSASPAVTDNGDGYYTATYTPLAVGTDVVVITLDGAPISASPYHSDVAPTIVKSGPSKNTQYVPVGSDVPYPPSVKLTDGSGTPIAGVTVAFTALSGGGTVVPTSVVSNGSGIATVERWTVGPAPGTNKLRAAVSPSSYVDFWAIAE